MKAARIQRRKLCRKYGGDTHHIFWLYIISNFYLCSRTIQLMHYGGKDMCFESCVSETLLFLYVKRCCLTATSLVCCLGRSEYGDGRFLFTHYIFQSMVFDEMCGLYLHQSFTSIWILNIVEANEEPCYISVQCMLALLLFGRNWVSILIGNVVQLSFVFLDKRRTKMQLL